jgi:hypothetical protein
VLRLDVTGQVYFAFAVIAGLSRRHAIDAVVRASGDLAL